MKTVTLKIAGMSCGHCINSIEHAIKQVGASAKVNLNEKSVIIEFDNSIVALDAIKEVIEKQGYEIIENNG